MNPIQRIAIEAAWVWFEELWESGQVDSARLRDLVDEVLSLFERIEQGSAQERDEWIVELVERLRAVDMSVF